MPAHIIKRTLHVEWIREPTPEDNASLDKALLEAARVWQSTHCPVLICRVDPQEKPKT